MSLLDTLRIVLRDVRECDADLNLSEAVVVFPMSVSLEVWEEILDVVELDAELMDAGSELPTPDPDTEIVGEVEPEDMPLVLTLAVGVVVMG